MRKPEISVFDFPYLQTGLQNSDDQLRVNEREEGGMDLMLSLSAATAHGVGEITFPDATLGVIVPRTMSSNILNHGPRNSSMGKL